MKVATVTVKCPICGDSQAIQRLGTIDTPGLDPLMQKFQCKRVTLKWEGDFGDERPWRKVSTVCGTIFYVAPPPKFTEVK